MNVDVSKAINAQVMLVINNDEARSLPQITFFRDIAYHPGLCSSPFLSARLFRRNVLQYPMDRMAVNTRVFRSARPSPACWNIRAEGMIIEYVAYFTHHDRGYSLIILNMIGTIPILP